MTKAIIPLLIACSLLALPGCAWEVGGGTKHTVVQPTVGQQLIDLQKAKESGAMTDSEYDAQKAKLLRRN